MVCFRVTKIKMHSTLVRSVISNAGCLSIRLYFRSSGAFPWSWGFIATHCFEIIWFGRTFYCISIQSRPPPLPNKLNIL
uniref:Uncharacterized protein n=1 Tax=Anguilla anguilla TaxID=7936 RepID=A0A0E9QXN6_ANGAN